MIFFLQVNTERLKHKIHLQAFWKKIIKEYDEIVSKYFIKLYYIKFNVYLLN